MQALGDAPTRLTAQSPDSEDKERSGPVSGVRSESSGGGFLARGKHGRGGAPAEEAGPELGVASRPKVEPGAWLDPGAWLAPEVVAPSSGLRRCPGFEGPLSAGGSGKGIGSTGQAFYT